MQSVLHKLATWFVLAVYAVSGVSPAQQLVVCLEPDGSVALEVASPTGCTPCEPGQESSPQVEPSGPDCCPCIDIPLPRRCEEPQARLGASEGRAPASAALPPVSIPALAAESARPPSLAHAGPRPASCLASIRTVVLRV